MGGGVGFCLFWSVQGPSWDLIGWDGMGRRWTNVSCQRIWKTHRAEGSK